MVLEAWEFGGRMRGGGNLTILRRCVQDAINKET